MKRARALSLDGARWLVVTASRSVLYGGKPWGGLIRAPWIDAPLWLMLAALCAVAAMSQAFRTVAAVVAGDLQAEFGASARDLGLFAGAFHISFAATQIMIGVALDVFGPRRTVTAAFLFAVLGALLSVAAPNLVVLIAGQLLIGAGCAPAFLGVIVFLANRYPADQFTGLSGLVLSFSGIGLLVTGTPLAAVVEAWSWRAAFVVLAASAALVLLAVVVLVADRPRRHQREHETLRQAFRQVGPILAQKHTYGILVLAAAAYASFITLRGLWAVPTLAERHGFTLVESGHVMLAASVAALLGPSIFGLLALGDRARRAWIVGCTAVYAGIFAVLALSAPAAVDVALTVLLGLLSGYFVLQYADVRAAYPKQVAGRALAVFNTAVFSGVALMQWITGMVASAANQHGTEPFLAVFATVSGLLAIAALGFLLLPWPSGMRQTLR